MPPPPTRIIAPGDKLPAVRPTLSDDESEESAEEEDPKSKILNAMPDTSRSSRRPPVLQCHKYDSFQVQTQTHSAIICAAGHVYVAATVHHVKIYDLNLSESPLLVLDGKDVGLKELKATSLEFCSAKAAQSKGRYVWIGTKDGHMLELDVITGQLMGTRLSIHFYPITRILRYGDVMLSLDDGGKVTIWMSNSAGEDLRLASAQVRGSRISDRQEFAEMFAGKLWTSARDTITPGARGPAVRVYDILNPGSATRTMLPTEHVGTVTSGTMLPSDPNHVYLGHEGGFVTVWLITTDDGIPVCEEVMRISNSDVLCLAGINDRLWVGGRNGTIAAYNVESRPWIMTNNWIAHWNGQSVVPLQKIVVDPYSIDKIGRLCVYSIGRDDHVKCWDGLLGADWQDTELLKLEKSFSHFRNITILFVSWNIGASKPEHLSGSKENSSFLYDALNSVEPPDIIVFGLQEVVPLDKANVAKFLKKKKGLEGASTTLHSEHRRWTDKLVGTVTFALPDERYKLLYTKELVGLLSCVMIKTKEQAAVRDYAAHTISRGVRGRFGNKGAIAVRLLVDDTSLCFLNCHLAAGHRRVRDRNADAAAIIEHEKLFPELQVLDEALAFVGGGDGTMALDHEIVFMSGDLNYRIDQRRDAVVSSVQQNTYESLLVHDQLTKEMKTNIRLHSFMEGPITFPPTYKYDLHSTEYDTSEKRRIPAWCDRVLWRARDPTRVEQLHYRRYEPDISDHRPISAAFHVLVKSIQHDARNKVKEEVQAQWSVREWQLLDNARAFFIDQLVL
ncbi:DNase I-like protein [Multifurca ochricompacta]|uniref:DNase I-like protein n=1 Tax=Multifurca ochricompacta TaxID=376703 RepID=A0AAD4M4R6_9AGAM|nr:DNase I-like protein [Multifurca ochricompacta]